MRVGWVGLGAMGAPMAACLARAGHEVTCYDVAARGHERGLGRLDGSALIEVLRERP